MARQKILLPFGGGLDRKTGSAVVDPDAMGNLHNVHLYRGRIEMRKGTLRMLDIGWGTDIIGIFPMRKQGVSGVVVFDAITRDVRLYLVDGTIAVATLATTLWTIPVAAAARGLPSVHGVDMYGQLVIAHDEAVIGDRQNTKVYFLSTGLTLDLESDLDRDTTVAPVKFRGVARHLNYLIGWGYGTDSDEDRPEMLRISKPGELFFVPEHYFLVGAQGDPIIGVGRSGPVLMIGKSSEAYRLAGTDHRTFGVDQMDANHGLLTSRLQVTVNGENFRWGLNGPRVSSGGESDDLEMPLDLAGPEADPLHTAAEADNAFAFYDPTEAEVVFVFDFWGYVLHLKDKVRRWSFRPYANQAASAGLIYQGGAVALGSGPVPTPPAWVARTVAAAAQGGWTGVAFGLAYDLSDRAVAVGNTGDGITKWRSMRSIDGGITWIHADAVDPLDLNVTRGWSAVGAGKVDGIHGFNKDGFVAVSRIKAGGGSTGNVATSDDGKEWSHFNLPKELNWNSVCFSPELALWVAVAESGVDVPGDDVATRVATAGVDASVWTTRSTAGKDFDWQSVCWSPEKALFVAVGFNTGGKVMTSPDGIVWTLQNCPDRAWASVCWSKEKGLFVAVAATGSKVGIVMTSPDGLVWTSQDGAYGSEQAMQWTSVVWGRDRACFMAVGNDLTAGAALAMSSPDGITWTGRGSAGVVNWSGVCYAQPRNRFIAVSITNAQPVVMTAP